MESITGIASATLQPITLESAAPPYTYFGVAQSMMRGVDVLAAATPPPQLR